MEETGKLAQPVTIRLYVLRLWRNGPAAPWRASVRHALTGAEKHFADVDKLCAFLRAEVEAAGAAPARLEGDG